MFRILYQSSYSFEKVLNHDQVEVRITLPPSRYGHSKTHPQVSRHHHNSSATRRSHRAVARLIKESTRHNPQPKSQPNLKFHLHLPRLEGQVVCPFVLFLALYQFRVQSRSIPNPRPDGPCQISSNPAYSRPSSLIPPTLPWMMWSNSEFFSLSLSIFFSKQSSLSL